MESHSFLMTCGRAICSAPITAASVSLGFNWNLTLITLVLVPRRWVARRSFAWLARFRRLSRGFERMPQVLVGLHFVVFAMLMLPKVALRLASGAKSIF